ncbi:helix-turn-helix domain-containing protein [Coleofasciculus chthonoplastes]|uniref:helix-turn-helix domain-containing protein n=1 Tax=Coleofasciculus chthonoplastes TaxID=64178 RepID=UPI0002FEA247|nr:helix-turn-helix transcriptional regulator [Coleofasciculus chthonoplastes]
MDLRALRERAGLRISDVAREIKSAESSIRNWEKGRTTPKMEVWQVFRLRDLYQCTEAELVQAVKESMLEEIQP